jgi:hypothetical protein
VKAFACALLWFGVAGFCLALLGAEIGIAVAAYCWLSGAFLLLLDWAS